VSETTLSAEVEAALLLRTTKALLTCGRNPNCDCSPCVVEAQEATLRTALERSARIEAAAKEVLSDHSERVTCGLGDTQPNRMMVMGDLRAALDREDG
jgi:hypothetical protein